MLLKYQITIMIAQHMLDDAHLIYLAGHEIRRNNDICIVAIEPDG